MMIKTDFDKLFGGPQQTNQSSEKPRGKFVPIPDGEYTFEIIDTGVETSASGFEQIKLQCEIASDGDFHGRMVWHRIIISHPDTTRQKAVEIGLAQLKELCSANGKSNWPAHHSDLHRWRFNAVLSYREYQGKFYENLKFFKAVRRPTGQYGQSAGYKAKMAELTGDMPVGQSFNDNDIPF
jgi:hypothetical protein